MVTKRSVRWLVPVLVAGIIAGCGGSAHTAATSDTKPAASAIARPTAPALADFRSERRIPEVAEPVRLRIPAIAVVTPLQRLSRAADGSVTVPTRAEDAGWYVGGPRPGQDGPAVLLGHVDSHVGPAVFFRLHELQKGDVVTVDRADGTIATFRVTRSGRYPKAQFPTASVYYPTFRPELRLITCGGTIDPRTGHYRDNLVVFASLA